MVRRLGPGDLARLQALNRMFAAAFDSPQSYTDHPPPQDYAEALLAREDVILLVAQEGAEVIGGIAAYVLPRFSQAGCEVYLYDLAVAAHRRRQGVASALIAALRKIARDYGASSVFVQADTVPEDEPARRLYRKLADHEISALHFDIAP